jgi:hypothetical protein
MTVIHFTKVSALYPRVVISLLAKRLGKPHFCHSYTSFGVWDRDHYMPLQRFIMGRMLGLTKVVHNTIILLRFSGVVAVPCPYHGPKQYLMSTQTVPKDATHRYERVSTRIN